MAFSLHHSGGAYEPSFVTQIGQGYRSGGDRGLLEH
jgi:hypothetical protein